MIPKIEIPLHRKIYSRAAVNDAIRGFSKFARCTMRQEGAYYRVTIDTPKKYEAQAVKGNFLNYVLMLSRARV